MFTIRKEVNLSERVDGVDGVAMLEGQLDEAFALGDKHGVATRFGDARLLETARQQRQVPPLLTKPCKPTNVDKGDTNERLLRALLCGRRRR